MTHRLLSAVRAVWRNGRARAIRFSTLDAICRVLDCQPGDILRWTEDRRG
jgi:putative transcriptional regulator